MSMNYELARQLKDAGYPQDERLSANGVFWDSETNTTVCFPTLRELIYACNDKFFELASPVALKGALWGASMALENSYIPSDLSTGATPEEAVAKLWLRINEKYETTIQNG